MREQPRRRPELTVLLVGVTALVLVTGALVFTRSRTDHYRNQLDAMSRDLGHRLALLQSTMARFEQSTALFDQGFQARDHAEAATDFAQTLTVNEQAVQQWQEFTATPPLLDGEAAARADVDAAIRADGAAGEKLGVAVLAPVPDPTQVAQLRAEQLATWATLQGSLRHLARDLYLPALLAQLDDTRADADSASSALTAATVVVLGLGTVLILVAYRRAARRGAAYRSEQRRQDLVAHENALDAELQHALDMTETESQVLDVIARALATPENPRPADFLLAESSLADFSHVVAPDDAAGTRCEVTAPHQCPVTRHGREAVFASSDALDSCAFLREHPAAPCAAVCMPVSVASRALGVIHECSPDGSPPPAHRVHELEIIARKAGERLSMLRAFAASERQAHTDPLTGLYNRRSLQEASARLGRDDLPLSVAFIDLDHFKDLNDTYGHDIGDRALRIFAGVLRASVRPDDIVSRYGGEEFVVVLPRCDATEAVRVLSRLQTTLADTLRTDTAPPFTISVGVAATIDPMSLDDLIALADGSLLRAKDLGRNRIVVAGEPTGPIAGPAITISEPVLPLLLGDRPPPDSGPGPAPGPAPGRSPGRSPGPEPEPRVEPGSARGGAPTPGAGGEPT